MCVCKRLYTFVSTYHSPNASEAFRFELISCFLFFFFLFVKTSSLKAAHAACSFFIIIIIVVTSAILWSEAAAQAAGCHRAKEKINSDRKNGGPQESLCGALALPCQLYTKTVMSGEAFHLSLHSYCGLRRSYDPLGCHRGRQNPTAGMTASVSLNH